MIANKVLTFKMIIPAGKATPAPPIGPLMGQLGLKSQDLCKQFNDRTKDYILGTLLPVVLYVNYDKTFTFVIKQPQTTFLLKTCSGIEKGSDNPKLNKVGRVSLKYVYEIARLKKLDPFMQHKSLEAICRSVVGTAKSMGLEVVP